MIALTDHLQWAVACFFAVDLVLIVVVNAYLVQGTLSVPAE